MICFNYNVFLENISRITLYKIYTFGGSTPMPESYMILKISFCSKLFMTIFTFKFPQLMMNNIHVGFEVGALGKLFVTQITRVVSNLKVSFVSVTFQVTFLVKHLVTVVAFVAFNSSMFRREVSRQVTHLEEVLRTFLKK